MKTYCKDVDITKRELISGCAYACLQNKYKRRDVLRLLASHSEHGVAYLKRAYAAHGACAVSAEVERVIDTIRAEIQNRELVLKPIWYRDKIDASNHKVRRIGIQDIKQQIYDYIAVEGLRPILRRIGEYQCASIPGRGQRHGVSAIRRWVRNPHIRYAVKVDVHKCFESIDHDALMAWLRHRVRNDTLLWLVDTLIRTFEQGLSIGSFLSQYLCNLYLSDLYHFISENAYVVRKSRKRRGNSRRMRLVRHVLFYMDDILLLGGNLKHLKMAVRALCVKVEQLKLRIKDKRSVYSLGEHEFIDMMGVRIYRSHITIRGYVFLRIRRAFCKLWRRIKTHQPVPVSLARRCASYYGILKSTDSFELRVAWHVATAMRVCKGVISRESSVRAAARAA